MNALIFGYAVRHKDSVKEDWGERDVVPLSPAVREANPRNKVVPRACLWGSTIFCETFSATYLFPNNIEWSGFA